MRKIVYYVATSLDGFIAGPDNDISGFVAKGKGVDQYLADLQDFDTVIMGRNTYEFGYQYGLQPGKPAYQMEHFIFSNSLHFEDPDPKVHVVPVQLEEVERIQRGNGSNIYLCGGGLFAGWLLDHDKIDVLKIKLNPFISGKGIRLFGNSTRHVAWSLVDTAAYQDGLQIITYKRE